MHPKTVTFAFAVVLCSLSCARQNTGPANALASNDKSSAAPQPGQSLSPPVFSSTNYIIQIVQPPPGTNFSIRRISPNPSNSYALRYVPR